MKKLEITIGQDQDGHYRWSMMTEDSEVLAHGSTSWPTYAEAFQMAVEFCMAINQPFKLVIG